MVVVLGHEEHVIDDAHGLIEPGMSCPPNDQPFVVSFQARDERGACLPECAENVSDGRGGVIGVVRSAILEIRGRQPIGTALEVVEPGGPERLEIQEMPGVFLDRPMAGRTSRQRFRVEIMNPLLQSRRRPAESLDQIRKRPRLEIEREASREPARPLDTSVRRSQALVGRHQPIRSRRRVTCATWCGPCQAYSASI